METLVECRICGVPFKKNDHSRLLVAGNSFVAFTPMEYRLLLALLAGDIVEDKTLIIALFGSDQVDPQLRQNLKKHVENAKGKLKPVGLYIRRIHLYGYSLVRAA